MESAKTNGSGYTGVNSILEKDGPGGALLEDGGVKSVSIFRAKSNTQLSVNVDTRLPTITTYVAYPIRWLILTMFVFYSTFNAFQWTQLVIITNILEKYYSVSTLSVSWTSMIYMVVYIPLIFPASWFLQKKGLRWSVLLGSLGTCLGSWIKVLATSRDQFWLLFSGQTVVAVSQIFILGIPAQLAATWFPASQVSSACAIGVFGNQLGVALGFVIPASWVVNKESVEDYHEIGHDLFEMFLAVAVLTTVLLVCIIFAFQDRPKTPPSRAQEILWNSSSELQRRKRNPPPSSTSNAGEENNQRVGDGTIQDGGSDNIDEREAEQERLQQGDENIGTEAEEGQIVSVEEENFSASIKRLLTNVNYLLLLITYGLNVGVFYAISTLLNTVVLKHFQNAEEDAGRIGLLIVICGMVGSMVCGVILDKTHAFKTTTLLVYVFSLVGMIAYTFTFQFGHIEIVYTTAALLGFFMTGYLPLGFEFAAEITYPESEGTSSGLLNASAQVFGIICTMGAERVYQWSDTEDRYANGSLCVVLLLGSILTALIKPDYRRQAAINSTGSPLAPANV